jgi:hypothetical protein
MEICSEETELLTTNRIAINATQLVVTHHQIKRAKARTGIMLTELRADLLKKLVQLNREQVLNSLTVLIQTTDRL